MSYMIRAGDPVMTDNPKFGALTHSVNLYDYREGGFSPEAMWSTQPAIRTVIDFMTDALSLVPFDVYRRIDGGREKAHDHELQRALRSPMPKVGQKRWVQRLQRDMLLYGRWACFVYQPNDKPIRLVRLPAHAISFAADSFGQITELVVRLNDAQGRPVTMTRPADSDDIVFDINDSGRGGKHVEGVTPVSVLEGLARETEGLNVYRSQLFKNSAMVPAVIERPHDAGKWTDEAWRRFKETFATYSAGGGNVGGTPILEDGMTLKPVQVFNPRDAEYIETRKLALVEAAQALHVPPELLGAVEGTHSNIVALREQLYVDVLGSALGYFEDALNVCLQPLLGDDAYIEANLEVRLRATAQDRMKMYQTSVGRPIMTAAEARERENLPFIEGSEELIVPLNVTEGGLAGPDDTGDTNEEGGDPYKGQRMTLQKAAPPKAAGPARKHARAALDELVADFAPRAEEVKAAIFRKLNVEAIAELQAAAPNAKASVGLPTIDQAFADFQVATLQKSLRVRLKAVAAAGSRDLLTELGVEDWSVWSAQKQSAWVEKAAQSWAEYVVHKQYIGTVNEAVAKDPGTWAMKVRDTMGTPEAINAASLGMGKQVESFGRHDGAHAAGARTKTWRSTSPEPRASHRALSGTTIDVDAVFSNGCRYPGDSKGPEPETSHCKCVLTYSKDDPE